MIPNIIIGVLIIGTIICFTYFIRKFIADGKKKKYTNTAHSARKQRELIGRRRK